MRFVISDKRGKDMNKGTRIRTVLGVAIALYVALYKTDVTDFGNDTVNLIYQILMKAVTFVVIFIVTYYNNDYTEIADKYTQKMRQEKAEIERAQEMDEYMHAPLLTEEGDIQDHGGEVTDMAEDEPKAVEGE